MTTVEDVVDVLETGSERGVPIELPQSPDAQFDALDGVELTHPAEDGDVLLDADAAAALALLDAVEAPSSNGKGKTKRAAKPAKSLYEERQEQLKAVKEKGKQQAKEKKAAERKARKPVLSDEDKAAAKATAKAEREAKRVEARAERDKAKEAARLEAAARREEMAVPPEVKKENAETQALFIQHYADSRKEGIRRPRSDRGDFAAGWITALRYMRKLVRQEQAAEKRAAKKASAAE